MDVSRIFAQPKHGPDLTDGTPYTINLYVFLRGSMNLIKSTTLGSMNLIKTHDIQKPSEAFLVTFWTDEKPYKCIGSK